MGNFTGQRRKALQQRKQKGEKREGSEEPIDYVTLKDTYPSVATCGCYLDQDSKRYAI